MLPYFPWALAALAWFSTGSNTQSESVQSKRDESHLELSDVLGLGHMTSLYFTIYHLKLFKVNSWVKDLDIFSHKSFSVIVYPRSFVLAKMAITDLHFGVEPICGMSQSSSHARRARGSNGHWHFCQKCCAKMSMWARCETLARDHLPLTCSEDTNTF